MRRRRSTRRGRAGKPVRIKFLHTTPSAAPGLPFQAGQIIDVPTVTPEMLGWIRAGLAISLDEDETAMLGEPVETTALPAKRSRGSR